jgi:hypothetical protein
MSGLWESFRQWCYPPPFRIRNVSAAFGLLLVELEEIQGKLAALSDKPDPVGDSLRVGTPSALDKDFAVNLCNQLHRLHRSVSKALLQRAPEAERIDGHLAGVRTQLEERGFVYRDLTGQRYAPEREDFEILGDPQPSSGASWPTIVQCERPAVLLKGKVVQRAKGVVSIPAAS